MMKIEYIYHSGFTVETENFFLVFDYYKGDIQLKDKPTYVFCSHSHEDHFNPEIFNWAKTKDDIGYILSSDIEDIPLIQAVIMSPDQEYDLGNISVKTFGSTDRGVSFLVHVDDKDIFFAGDLNWWHWNNDTDEEKRNEEAAFKGEINNIKGINIDLGFFPVDPRLEENYYLGGEYFIQALKPKVFVPMHFGDNYEVIKKFIHKMDDSSTNIVEISSRNQVFHIE